MQAHCSVDIPPKQVRELREQLKAAEERAAQSEKEAEDASFKAEQLLNELRRAQVCVRPFSCGHGHAVPAPSRDKVTWRWVALRAVQEEAEQLKQQLCAVQVRTRRFLAMPANNRKETPER